MARAPSLSSSLPGEVGCCCVTEAQRSLICLHVQLSTSSAAVNDGAQHVPWGKWIATQIYCNISKPNTCTYVVQCLQKKPWLCGYTHMTHDGGIRDDLGSYPSTLVNASLLVPIACAPTQSVLQGLLCMISTHKSTLPLASRVLSRVPTGQDLGEPDGHVDQSDHFVYKHGRVLFGLRAAICIAHIAATTDENPSSGTPFFFNKASSQCLMWR